MLIHNSGFEKPHFPLCLVEVDELPVILVAFVQTVDRVHSKHCSRFSHEYDIIVQAQSNDFLRAWEVPGLLSSGDPFRTLLTAGACAS